LLFELESDADDDYVPVLSAKSLELPALQGCIEAELEYGR
jgi:hypothetical protein